jgi:hypothetical protein
VLLGLEYVLKIPNSGFIISLVLSGFVIFFGRSLFQRKTPWIVCLMGLTFVFAPEIAKRTFILTPEIAETVLITTGLMLALDGLESGRVASWAVSAILLGACSGFRNEAAPNLMFLLVPFYGALIIKKKWGADAYYEVPGKYYWDLRFLWNDVDRIRKKEQWDAEPIVRVLRKQNVRWIYQTLSWDLVNYAGPDTMKNLKDITARRPDLFPLILEQPPPDERRLYEILLPGERASK